MNNPQTNKPADASRFSIVAIALIYTAMAVLIGVLCWRMMWFGDEIIYGRNLATLEPLRRLSDIIESQNRHWFILNGRYVAHCLVQLFCGFLGKGTFAVANSLIYIALVAMMLKLAGLRQSDWTAVAAATLITLFFVDTKYTPSTQIGYVWMGWLTLVFLWIYLGNHKFNGWQTAGLVVLSLLAGNGHEVLNVGVGAALIIDMAMHFRDRDWTRRLMFVSFGAGALFLCLSPATLYRSTGIMSIPPSVSLINILLFLRVFYVMIAVLIVQLCRRKLSLRQFYVDNSFYVNTIIVLFLFNFIIRVTFNRQLFGIELLSAVLLLKLLKDMMLRWVVIALTLCAVTAQYITKFKLIDEFNATYRTLIKEIENDDDGLIFYDLPKKFEWVDPVCPALDYESFNVFGIYRPGQEKCSGVLDAPVYLFPTSCEELLKNNGNNYVVKLDKDRLFIIQSLSNPKQFVMHRNSSFMGIQRYNETYPVEFTEKNSVTTAGHKIIYVNDRTYYDIELNVEIIDD